MGCSQSTGGECCGKRCTCSCALICQILVSIPIPPAGPWWAVSQKKSNCCFCDDSVIIFEIVAWIASLVVTSSTFADVASLIQVDVVDEGLNYARIAASCVWGVCSLISILYLLSPSCFSCLKCGTSCYPVLSDAVNQNQGQMQPNGGGGDPSMNFSLSKARRRGKYGFLTDGDDGEAFELSRSRRSRRARRMRAAHARERLGAEEGVQTSDGESDY